MKTPNHGNNGLYALIFLTYFECLRAQVEESGDCQFLTRPQVQRSPTVGLWARDRMSAFLNWNLYRIYKKNCVAMGKKGAIMKQQRVLVCRCDATASQCG